MKCHVVAATLTTLILAVQLTGVRCRPDRIQACGKELADILQKMCLGEYNTYYQSNAEENLSNGTRRKRGITQECCLQSCSLKDIMQYCSGGPPINATESLPVDSSPGRVPNTSSRMKMSANNSIYIEDEKESNSSPRFAPSTPPPPRLGQPPFQEPHANVTSTPPGVYTKPPWFRKKVPLIVLYINDKFNFGHNPPSKVASAEEKRTGAG